MNRTRAKIPISVTLYEVYVPRDSNVVPQGSFQTSTSAKCMGETDILFASRLWSLDINFSPSFNLVLHPKPLEEYQLRSALISLYLKVITQWWVNFIFWNIVFSLFTMGQHWWESIKLQLGVKLPVCSLEMFYLQTKYSWGDVLDEWVS